MQFNKIATVGAAVTAATVVLGSDGIAGATGTSSWSVIDDFARERAQRSTLPSSVRVAL